MGYIQLRKGPNKVSFNGILQPFNDAIKLFSKEFIFPIVSNMLIFFYCPLFILLLSLFVWLVIPYIEIFYHFNYGLIFILCVLAINIYFLILSGWSSNRNYSLLGSLRGVAQVISYEVSLILLMLSLIFLIKSYNLLYFFVYQKFLWFIFIALPLSFCLFSSMLAETNRSPFDFAEGESELVSGFNIEYGAGGFALIFLAEYSRILFMRILFCLLFLGGDVRRLIFYIKLIILRFLFIWVRGTLPRYRYDKLIYLTWKIFLPVSLNYLIFFLSFCFLWNFFSKINRKLIEN